MCTKSSRLGLHRLTATQVTTVCTIINGTTIKNDSLCILSLVEEGGELKVSRVKEFTDPQTYRDHHSSQAAIEKAAAS